MIPVAQLTIHHVSDGKVIEVQTPLGFRYRVRRALTSNYRGNRRYTAIASDGKAYYYPSIADVRLDLGRL
jgi:hypothetical protein